MRADTFNRAQYDRLIDFQTRERAQRAAAQQARQQRAQAIYDAVYAARFAVLRAQRHSVENADYFARRDAEAAARATG